MNALDRARWIRLWPQLGAAAEPVEWFDRLNAAYSEPHRRYHNSQHIADCLREFDSVQHLAPAPHVVEAAIWFHDARYDPRAGDNEEQSAEWARRCLEDAGVSGEICRRVVRLVLATKTHDPGDDPNAALMIDIDLSILGQSEERFAEYERQVRGEYGWVPKFIFRKKRAEILSHFLARPRLYATDWFCQKYEAQARANLRASIAQLRAGRGS